jgi:RNA polymerase sigma-70 factor (ECF subfamily)
MSRFLEIEIPAEIVAAAVRGDNAAHEAIYRASNRAVYTLIRRLIPRGAIADELLQEVFVEILRSVGTYRGPAPIGAWIRTIAVNKCLMYLRSPWHRSLLWLDARDTRGAFRGEASVDVLDEAAQFDVELDLAADLERALAELPALTRSVVWLHDVEGYTHSEIARELGGTVSFSKSQLARAHKRLRELLSPSEGSLSCTPLSNNC